MIATGSSRTDVQVPLAGHVEERLEETRDTPPGAHAHGVGAGQLRRQGVTDG